MEDEMWNLAGDMDRKSRATLRENGMTVYTPTAEEIEAWKAVSQPVYDNYMEKAGALGAQIMQAAKSL